MLIRVLLSIFLVLIFSMFSYYKPFTFMDSVKDNTNIQTMKLLDMKLVEYYLNNTDDDAVRIDDGKNSLNPIYVVSGILPESLDDKTLKEIGMESLDTSVFVYRKLSNDKFSLTYRKLSDKSVISSKNSDRKIDKIQVVVW